jgi:hypothetical protein
VVICGRVFEGKLQVFLTLMLVGIVESAPLLGHFISQGKPVWFPLCKRHDLKVEAKRNIPCEI